MSASSAHSAWVMFSFFVATSLETGSDRYFVNREWYHLLVNQNLSWERTFDSSGFWTYGGGGGGGYNFCVQGIPSAVYGNPQQILNSKSRKSVAATNRELNLIKHLLLRRVPDCNAWENTSWCIKVPVFRHCTGSACLCMQRLSSTTWLPLLLHRPCLWLTSVAPSYHLSTSTTTH